MSDVETMLPHVEERIGDAGSVDVSHLNDPVAPSYQETAFSKLLWQLVVSFAKALEVTTDSAYFRMKDTIRGMPLWLVETYKWILVQWKKLKDCLFPPPPSGGGSGSGENEEEPTTLFAPLWKPFLIWLVVLPALAFSVPAILLFLGFVALSFSFSVAFVVSLQLVLVMTTSTLLMLWLSGVAVVFLAVGVAGTGVLYLGDAVATIAPSALSLLLKVTSSSSLLWSVVVPIATLFGIEIGEQAYLQKENRWKQGKRRKDVTFQDIPETVWKSSGPADRTDITGIEGKGDVGLIEAQESLGKNKDKGKEKWKGPPPGDMAMWEEEDLHLHSPPEHLLVEKDQDQHQEHLGGSPEHVGDHDHDHEHGTLSGFTSAGEEYVHVGKDWKPEDTDNNNHNNNNADSNERPEEEKLRSASESLSHDQPVQTYTTQPEKGEEEDVRLGTPQEQGEGTDRPDRGEPSPLAPLAPLLRRTDSPIRPFPSIGGVGGQIARTPTPTRTRTPVMTPTETEDAAVPVGYISSPHLGPVPFHPYMTGEDTKDRET